jgi:hypothetical protein
MQLSLLCAGAQLAGLMLINMLPAGGTFEQYIDAKRKVIRADLDRL